MGELTKGILITIAAFIILGYLWWVLKDKFKTVDHHSILRSHLIDDGLSYEDADEIVSSMSLREVRKANKTYILKDDIRV